VTPKQPLAVTHPELAKQAIGWDPSLVTASSGLKKEWMCGFCHAWIASTYTRTSGSDCPFCRGQNVLAGFNDFATTDPEIGKQAHGWDPTTLSRWSDRKVQWICDHQHEWTSSLGRRTSGKNCPIYTDITILVGLNDIASQNPRLTSQAEGRDPKMVTAGSNQNQLWRWDKGHQLVIIGGPHWPMVRKLMNSSC